MVQVQVVTTTTTVPIQSSITISEVQVPEDQTELESFVDTFKEAIQTMIQNNLEEGEVQDVTIISIGDVYINMRRSIRRLLRKLQSGAGTDIEYETAIKVVTEEIVVVNEDGDVVGTVDETGEIQITAEEEASEQTSSSNTQTTSTPSAINIVAQIGQAVSAAVSAAGSDQTLFTQILQEKAAENGAEQLSTVSFEGAKEVEVLADKITTDEEIETTTVSVPVPASPTTSPSLSAAKVATLSGSTKLDITIPASTTISGVACDASTDLSELGASLGELLQKQACIAGSTCHVDLDKVTCNVTRRDRKLASSHQQQRRQQTSTNDVIVEFKTIITTYCQTTDCSDAQSIVNAISDDVQTNLGGGAMSDILATIKAQAVGSLATLMATAVVSSPTTFGDILIPLLDELTKWYPDWHGGTGTCKNDGEYPFYMNRYSPWGSYFKNTLKECCDHYFSWAYNNCVSLGGGSTDTLESDEYYFDYQSESCKQNCLKDTPGKNCGGLADGWMKRFDTAEKCCEEKLWWVNQGKCKADSTGSAADLAAANAGTGKWYVDWIKEMCVKDCSTSATDPACGGLAEKWEETRLFSSANDCCSDSLSYVDRAKCTV